MRRHLLPVLALVAAFAAAPVSSALAQGRGGQGGGDDDAGASKKKKDEWEDRQAPLPGLRNAGPCPFVKVLYDAGRYVEMDTARLSAATVGFTGEIQDLSSGCRYKSGEAIHLEVEVLFALGKGPKAVGQTKTFPYWVAVTDRNRNVLAKEYFSLPVKFPEGQDRVLVTDRLNTITIPRADDKVSGANFEVLIGFDVTPEMADFNREGKRFRVNAGAVAAVTPGGAPAKP